MQKSNHFFLKLQTRKIADIFVRRNIIGNVTCLNVIWSLSDEVSLQTQEFAKMTWHDSLVRMSCWQRKWTIWGTAAAPSHYNPARLIALLRREHQLLWTSTQAQDRGVADADVLAEIFGWKSKPKQLPPTPPTRARSMLQSGRRTESLRTSSADASRERTSQGGSAALTREISMQLQQIKTLEETIRKSCQNLGISVEQFFTTF